MIVQLVEIPKLDFKLLKNYSVLLPDCPYSEYKDFLRRIGEIPELKDDLISLNNYISKIGNYYGALPQHFKPEKNAERLPPPYHFLDGDFGIRLYCIRATDKVVILLTGCHKTAQKVKDCPNCNPHFLMANKIALAFHRAVNSGFVEINNKEIEYTTDDFDLEI